MTRRTWVSAVVFALIALLLGASWYVGYANRTHPAIWAMVGGDSARRYQSPDPIPAQPKVLWTVTLEETGTTQPVVWKDGTIFVGNGTKVIAVDREGKRLWAWNSQSQIQSLALGRHGTLYVQADNVLYALSLTGEKQWQYDTQVGRPRQLLVGQGGTIYVTGNEYIYAMTDDGKLKWRFRGGRINSDPIESEKGNLFFTIEDKLYQIDRNGDELWNAEVSTAQSQIILPGPEGTTYVRGSEIVVVNKDGLPVYKVPTNEVTSMAGVTRLTPASALPEKLGQMITRRSTPTLGTMLGGNMAAGKDFTQDGVSRLNHLGQRDWAFTRTVGAGYTNVILDRQGSALTQMQAAGTPLAVLYKLDSTGQQVWRFEDAFSLGSAAPAGNGRIVFVGRVPDRTGAVLVCLGDR